MTWCRHRRNWAIAGGYWLWCYECGAIRLMQHVGGNAFAPAEGWVKPTGIGGPNPWKPSKPRKEP